MGDGLWHCYTNITQHVQLPVLWGFWDPRGSCKPQVVPPVAAADSSAPHRPRDTRRSGAVDWSKSERPEGREGKSWRGAWPVALWVTYWISNVLSWYVLLITFHASAYLSIHFSSFFYPSPMFLKHWHADCRDYSALIEHPATKTRWKGRLVDVETLNGKVTNMENIYCSRILPLQSMSAYSDDQVNLAMILNYQGLTWLWNHFLEKSRLNMFVCLKQFPGWWFETLWKILVSWYYSQYMGK